MLGIYLQAGIGCNKEEKKGKALIRKAAQQGMRLAQILLGHWPDCTTSERLRASFLLSEFDLTDVDQDGARLYHTLGVPYFLETGSAEHFKLVMNVFRAAADSNCVDAMFLVACNDYNSDKTTFPQERFNRLGQHSSKHPGAAFALVGWGMKQETRLIYTH